MPHAQKQENAAHDNTAGRLSQSARTEKQNRVGFGTRCCRQYARFAGPSVSRGNEEAILGCQVCFNLQGDFLF